MLQEHWERLLDDRAEAKDLAGLAEVHRIPVVVDLFKSSTRVVHAPAVYDLVTGGLMIAEAARWLSVAETSGNRAYRTGVAMVELGLVDAYVKLESKPELPSRWTSRSRPSDASQQA